MSYKLREDAMRIFSQDELGSVRAFNDEAGDAWFLASDVCRILELENVARAISRLDEDEKTYLTLSKVSQGTPKRACVNTPGLYRLILSSRKPQAHAFKRWVTHVVLPSILEGKNSEGAFAYIYGQEDIDDPQTSVERKEELKTALRSTVKVTAPPQSFAVINGIRMTWQEARNWDRD